MNCWFTWISKLSCLFSIFFFSGLNMMDIGSRGSVCRIKKCALDFLSIVDLMDGEDGWDLMRRDIRLKSTFLYCDFNQVISNAAKEEKQPLIDLANKLFQSIEEVHICGASKFIVQSLNPNSIDSIGLIRHWVRRLGPSCRKTSYLICCPVESHGEVEFKTMVNCLIPSFNMFCSWIMQCRFVASL